MIRILVISLTVGDHVGYLVVLGVEWLGETSVEGLHKG